MPTPEPGEQIINAEQQHRSLAFWYLWPNTGISLFPGSPFFVIATFEPVSEESCRIHLKMYSSEAVDNREFEAFRHARFITLEEDIAACESVQRGMHSRGYHQGRFIVNDDQPLVSESGVHHFHRMLLNALSN